MEHDVLFISPNRADAGVLAKMLGQTSIRLDHVSDLAQARRFLKQRSCDAILTEARLPDADWTDVLQLAYDLEPRPAVLVTERLADDLFWAEVLNLGAYDLLAQPFDTGEVQRILANACAQVSFRPIPVHRAEKSRALRAAV